MIAVAQTPRQAYTAMLVCVSIAARTYASVAEKHMVAISPIYCAATVFAISFFACGTNVKSRLSTMIFSLYGVAYLSYSAFFYLDVRKSFVQFVSIAIVQNIARARMCRFIVIDILTINCMFHTF